ncbi:MAG: TraR/DksA C4-type zinc finger protein, partial [Opitutales bacterium]|nr:TraR/DksA C4-type zinc finger protein [Opitutales bacterium]
TSKSLQRDLKRRAIVNAKATPKKIVSTKSTGKAISKKVESNVKKDKKISKPAPKKAEKKVSKPASSKPQQKKVQPKKTTPVKKEVAKKPVAKKTEKVAPKKVEKAPKKEAKVVEKPAKKEVEKKSSKKEKAVEKVEPKKTEKKKAEAPVLPKEEVVIRSSSGKFRIRPSHNIYFSIEDLNAYFEKRDTSVVATQREKIVSKTKATPVVAKPVVAPAPRQPLTVATVFDILGLNPVVAKTHDKLEEQDVPRKWKKYYKMLVDLRKHHSSGVEMRSEEVLKRSAKDDAGDLSSYGQHLADAGSESFERDIAYNLISNQKEILSEIDEAIKRIKNGTYGICEITGKPIPESRLLSIPYTRCTLEGQQIKEAEIKRQKASQRASLYDMTDGTSQSVPSDEDSISE